MLVLEAASGVSDDIPDCVDHGIRRLELNHVAAVFDSDLSAVCGKARKIRL
jgi:hypothetical protein